MQIQNNHARALPGSLPRKRILIVNCYFDDSRQPICRTTKVPQAVGPIYLAAFFNRQLCDVRCYTELASGPLEDENTFGWPDMLVLTGLTNTFDRLLHLTAYARSKNPRVIVVAGGPAVRALPVLARRYFDYVCHGDIEEMRHVIADAFSEAYVSHEDTPRYDLGYWLGPLGYIESSRYCNFRCSFCSLTGEGRGYQTYDLDNIRKQILAAGKKKLFFLDNNFYGSDRQHFRARVQLLKEMHEEKRISKWSALVTNDFYSKEENISFARASGCELLFTGVEAFDTKWLHCVNKNQNNLAPQVQLIEKCLNAGIVFCYGLVLDVGAKSISDLRREIDFVTATPEITLPAFLTIAIPILGTPYFLQCLKNGTLLPNTKLRDMDGMTLCNQSVDSVDEVVRFLKDFEGLHGYRSRVLKHSAAFFRRYRSKLNAEQMAIAVGQGLLLCSNRLSTSLTSGGWLGRRKPRTYVSTTEALDSTYDPAFRIDSRFESYFKPTMVTDACGQLHNDLIGSGLLEK